MLATVLDAFKRAVLRAREHGEEERLAEWTARIGLESVERLTAAARRPTRIVPANITFYPLHVSDNVLRRGMELVKRGLSRRLPEELLIEGNILPKDTDMDIQLGEPALPGDAWRWWDRRLVDHAVRRIGTLDGFFALRRDQGRWDERLLSRPPAPRHSGDARVRPAARTRALSGGGGASQGTRHVAVGPARAQPPGLARLGAARLPHHVGPLAARVALVGFSTGGALSLLLAAEGPEGLAGVAAVCVPFKFRNRNLVFVPLVHGATAWCAACLPSTACCRSAPTTPSIRTSTIATFRYARSTS